MAILTPGGTSQGLQPAVQYGCRVVPINLAPVPGSLPALEVQNGLPVVVASATEADLYQTPNEGPAACTYDPASNTGMLLVHKEERDPGFEVYLMSTFLSF